MQVFKARIPCLLLLALILIGTSASAQIVTPDLKIYPPPPGAAVSTQYEVLVSVDGLWEPSFVNFDISRDSGGGARDEAGKTFSWTTFETRTPATVRVRRLEGGFESVVLRPERYGIKATRVADDTVELTLKPGQKLSVEFDTEVKEWCYTGSPYGLRCIKDALLLFADPRKATSAIAGISPSDIYRVEPGSHEELQAVSGGSGLQAGRSTLGDCNGKRVVVFPPGVYDIGYWQVPNNIEHVHLEGGALVFGALDVIPRGRAPFHDAATINHVYRDDWRGETLRAAFSLTGPGIISGAKLPWHLKKDFSCTSGDDWWAHVKVVQLAVEQVTLDDVTIANSPHWVLSFINDNDERTQGTFDNFKMVGAWTYNNDGLPNPAGSESSISNCFIHADDDAFKIYNSGSSIENCVVWQNNNGAVFQFGWFPKTVNDVTVSNVDIIHFENWYGVGQVNRALFNYADSGGNGTIHGIEFNNINVEGPILRLFGFHCIGGQVIRDIKFNNLSVPGGMGFGNLGSPGRNYFLGNITDFTFHNFTFGDTVVTSAEEAWFDFGDGAGEGFVFTDAGPPVGRAGPEPLSTLPMSSVVLEGARGAGDQCCSQAGNVPHVTSSSVESVPQAGKVNAPAASPVPERACRPPNRWGPPKDTRSPRPCCCPGKRGSLAHPHPERGTGGRTHSSSSSPAGRWAAGNMLQGAALHPGTDAEGISCPDSSVGSPCWSRRRSHATTCMVTGIRHFHRMATRCRPGSAEGG